MKIGFIGCGQMAQAMIGAFIEGKVVTSSQVICSDINQGSLDIAKNKYGVSVTTDNNQVFGNADVIFLAVKPQMFVDAVAGCRNMVNAEHLIISIMAGVTIAKIREVLPAPVARVMPNTPCLIGQMAAGYAVGDNVPADKLDYVVKLLSCTGLAIKVEESDLDAVTGVSGSGPAFVAYLIQQFIDGGVKEGLSPDQARELAIMTFIGTGSLLKEKNLSPDELIKMVSSPNGTTVAGREVLENSNVPEIISNTISRAAQRSRELSK